MMKKQFLEVVMLCMSTLCVAQADKQEATYRRSSLYTLMIGTAVTINLKALRTYLENEKIIKPLDSLFE